MESKIAIAGLALLLCCSAGCLTDRVELIGPNKAGEIKRIEYRRDYLSQEQNEQGVYLVGFRFK